MDLALTIAHRPGSSDFALLSLGYNIAGFRDPDFNLDRALDQGLLAAIRFKFDADVLGFNGDSAPAAGINPQDGVCHVDARPAPWWHRVP